MGFLSPSCVTARNGRIYAFGKTLSLDTSAPAYFLVQSNPNPSHTLQDLSWTLVSIVSTEGYSEIMTRDFFSILGAFHFCCTIDDKGVFSILNIDNSNTKTGLQYQPSSSDPSGTGTWRNITVPLNYQWDYLKSTELFNYQDNQGQNTLMHVTLGNQSQVCVASLDSTTMTMKQSPRPWNITGSFSSYTRTVSSNGRSIFGYGEGAAIGKHLLSEYPLSSNSTSPVGSPKNYNASDIQAVNPIFRGSLIKAVGEIIVVFSLETIPTHFFVFGGAGFIHLPSMPETIPDEFYLRFMAGIDTSPVPFIFYRDDKGTYSIPINGSLAGVRLPYKDNITINERYGDPGSRSSTPSVSTRPIPTWVMEPKESHGNNGAVIGGVSAVVVVVLAILGFMFYRRKRMLDRTRGGGGTTKPMQSVHHQEEPYPSAKISSAPILLGGENAVALGQDNNSPLNAWERRGTAPPGASTGQSALTTLELAPQQLHSNSRPDLPNPSHGFP